MGAGFAVFYDKAGGFGGRASFFGDLIHGHEIGFVSFGSDGAEEVTSAGAVVFHTGVFGFKVLNAAPSV